MILFLDDNATSTKSDGVSSHDILNWYYEQICL